MTNSGMAAITFALLANLAHADDYLSPTNERVRLSLGAMRLTSTTSLRVDSSQGVVGTPIDAEKDFGLDSANLEPKFQAMVRVGERHRLRFDYFTLDRSGQTTLAGGPRVFRDVVLQSGDPSDSNLSLRALGISYGYSIIHREKFEIAAIIGVNDIDVSSRVRVSTQRRRVDQSEDQAGPFPTLGLDATYVISKRFYFDARAQYMKVAVNHLSGSLGIYEINALYRLRPNIAFGLGYTAVKAGLVSRQVKDGGYFDFTSKGPQAFVRISF
ncbi:MAG: hypothetical protein M3N50_07375 [Pseudomonadota bacterium]|nr:hypothetical protein [Pseudomonadota bacterium]